MNNPTGSALEVVSTAVTIGQLVQIGVDIFDKIKRVSRGEVVTQADVQASLAALDQNIASLDQGIAQRKDEEADQLRKQQELLPGSSPG